MRTDGQRRGDTEKAGFDAQQNASKTALSRNVLSISLVFAALMLGDGALAQGAGDGAGEKAQPKAGRKACLKCARTPHALARKTAPAKAPAAAEDARGPTPTDKAIAKAAAASPARFDKVYGWKGWDIPFPSMGDSLLQDYGGWRSALASAGFGFLSFSVDTFNLNMLNTPTKVPAGSFVSALGMQSPYPYCSKTSGPVCAGSQTYFGQRPAYYTTLVSFLTYDMSQWGVPDGQIQIAGNWYTSSDQAYLPSSFQFTTVAWYQTLFNGKVELKIGDYGADLDFVGKNVGGSFANVFGVSATIPAELGLSVHDSPTPMARTTVHLTDALYDEFAVARSLPVNGPTGNPVYDEIHYSPTGLRFTVPGAGILLINEAGYKNAAAPGAPENWVRFGAMYNTSNFKDFTQPFTTAATIQGNAGFYFLEDRQLWQQAPGSSLTAYRGIYAGVSAMYAPPEETLFSQYYEGRLYWIGPFDSRPTDMISFVYTHNVFSHYLADQLNAANMSLAAQGFAVPLAYHAADTVTLSYLAHLTPGLYLGLGAGYTDHPSVEYFTGQGSSLNFLASATIVF